MTIILASNKCLFLAYEFESVVRDSFYFHDLIAPIGLLLMFLLLCFFRLVICVAFFRDMRPGHSNYRKQKSCQKRQWRKMQVG